MSTDNEIESVLSFWFRFDEAGKPVSKHWWTKSNEFDQEIRLKFVGHWQSAMTGKLCDWEKTPRGCLALITLLDQLSRNMFRNNAGSFSSDQEAIRVAKLAITKGFDMELPLHQRSLIYMPFMHSENIVDHNDYGIPCFDKVAEADTYYESMKQYMNKHYEIVKKWGRYPHRNCILNRESTPEEIEFLAQPGSSF